MNLKLSRKLIGDPGRIRRRFLIRIQLTANRKWIGDPERILKRFLIRIQLRIRRRLIGSAERILKRFLIRTQLNTFQKIARRGLKYAESGFSCQKDISTAATTSTNARQSSRGVFKQVSMVQAPFLPLSHYQVCLSEHPTFAAL